MALCTATSTVHFLFVSFIFLDITSVLRKGGHVAVFGAGTSKPSRRHLSRKDIHSYLLSEKEEPLHLKGLFSTLVNQSVDLNEQNSLHILLPALEQFENVMIEEAYRVRLTLQDHHERLTKLEMLLGQRTQKATATLSNFLTTTQKTIDNLDVPFSDSSANVSSATATIKTKRKPKSKQTTKPVKKFLRRGDMEVIDMYVETTTLKNNNNDTIANQTKEDNSVNISSSLFINDTEITVLVPSNETEATMENGTLVFINESITVDVNSTKISQKLNLTTEAPPEVNLIQDLKTKVKELELFKGKTSQIQLKSEAKVKQLEKSIVGLRGRFRKLRSKVSVQNMKISSLQGGQLQREQDPVQQNSQYATYFNDGYLKLDGRVDNLRDLVVRGRGEIRELKQVTEKHEQYIRELQSGSNAQEHQLRELMARLISVEQTVRNVYNSVDSHMSAIRWEVQVMLDNVCSNNNLHC